MAVAGRNPALLDTLGTIQLRAGRFDEAVAALEESVAGSASDPRYYFHLAAAYDGADESDKARKALSTAMELGLDKAILTEGDRQLLATLRRDIPSMGARARCDCRRTEFGTAPQTDRRLEVGAVR
jgi:predicted Zn-dependent protease